MKTVAEFLADWKVYGDDKEFIEALEAFQCDAREEGRLSSLPVAQEIVDMRRDLKRKSEALREIARHCQASGSPIAARMAQEAL